MASNNDNIVLEYVLSDDGYACHVTIDDKHAVTVNYKYTGVAENTYGEIKYTIESSVAEVDLVNTFNGRTHTFAKWA